MRWRRWRATWMRSGNGRPSDSLGALRTKIYACRAFPLSGDGPVHAECSHPLRPSSVSSLPRFVSERTSPLYLFCLRSLWRESAPAHLPSRRSRRSPLEWVGGRGALLCCTMLPWLLLLFLPLFGLKSRKSMLTRRDRDMMRARTHTDYFAGHNPPPPPPPSCFFFTQEARRRLELGQQEEVKTRFQPSHAQLDCCIGPVSGL